MKEWDLLIKQAKEALDAHKTVHALYLYKQVLNQSEDYYEKQLQSNADKALSNIIFCHFNLANTYLTANNHDYATQHLIKCFSFLKKQLHRDDISLRIHQAIIRAYSRCQTQWSLFRMRLTKFSMQPYEINNIETTWLHYYENNPVAK